MYTTFADCKQEVAAAINAGAADESEYDIDAIDEFWTSVANHDISEG